MGTRRLMRTATVLTTTAGLAVTVAACGGDDGGSGADGGGKDEAAITAVLNKAITTTDPEVKCVEAVSRSFVTRIYKTVAACRKAETREAGDSPKPTSAKITAIQVTGDKATATATAVGGDVDGASGEIALVREDGDWKVDDLSAGYLRAQLKQGFKNATYSADDGPLQDPAFRACLEKQLSALDDAAFKAVAYDSIAETEGTDPRFLKAFSACVGDTEADPSATPAAVGEVPPASSKIREQFETGLRQSAEKDDTAPKTIDCIVLKLRDSVTDAQILAASQEPRGSARSADNPITKKVAAAIGAC